MHNVVVLLIPIQWVILTVDSYARKNESTGAGGL